VGWREVDGDRWIKRVGLREMTGKGGWRESDEESWMEKG
ncbi:hypothetical protein A2U01_0103241, partial [Trifolium medium]|nr:hypothetical protein [Trifolium medium]